MPSGRNPVNVEFFRMLYDLSGTSSQREFAAACGRQRPAVSNYLAGVWTPGKRVLKDSIEHLYAWGIEPLIELERIPERINTLPSSPGVYVLYDSAGNVLYIGQATKFNAEVRQALGKRIPQGMYFGPKLKKKRPTIRDLATHLSLYMVANARLRHNLEALLLRVFVNQTHNLKIGRFK